MAPTQCRSENETNMENLCEPQLTTHQKFGPCYTFIGPTGIELLIPEKGLRDVYNTAVLNNGHAHGDVTVVARPGEEYQRESV